MKPELRLSQILSPELIRTHVSLPSKAAALEFLADLIATHHPELNRDEILQKILERERIMSTGVGKGFACPHAKLPELNQTTAALITLQDPIDFEAVDQQPVNIILMLLGPTTAVGDHLRLLSRISRLMISTDVRSRILQSQSPEELLTVLQQEEQKRIEATKQQREITNQ